MKAKEFLKQSYPIINLEDKFDYQTQQFSAEDMIEFAEKFAEQKKVEDVNHPFDYDSGLLNNYGGGDVDWWQDYIREEIARCNGYWRDYFEGL